MSSGQLLPGQMSTCQCGSYEDRTEAEADQDILFHETTAKETEGGTDTKKQMTTGPPDTVVSAINTSLFENFTGQMSSGVQPGTDSGAAGLTRVPRGC